MDKKSNGHTNNSSGSKKVILNNDNAPKYNPAWLAGAKKALKPFYWIAAITLLWCCVSFFKLVDPNLAASGTLLISVVLFLLSIPVGIILGMDAMASHYASSFSNEAVLIFALPIMLINFLVIGAYQGWRKSFKKNNATTPPKA